nr:cysteine-rich repeat secretory protein 38-like [Ipomoea batatas]
MFVSTCPRGVPFSDIVAPATFWPSTRSSLPSTTTYHSPTSPCRRHQQLQQSTQSLSEPSMMPPWQICLPNTTQSTPLKISSPSMFSWTTTDNRGAFPGTFVKAVEEIPYNISIIHISSVLPSAVAEVPAPEPSKANITKLIRLHYRQQDNVNKFYLSNTEPVSNPNVFIPTRNQLLRQLATKAAGQNSFYAAGDANVGPAGSSTMKVYGLVQCTRDLSGENCRNCLNGAIAELPQCCGPQQGGSCSVRYETYRFYN